MRKWLWSGRGRMADSLLEAVRGLWLADPELGPRPLLAKLREQQPNLGAGTREVHEALMALKAESEAMAVAAAVPPAAERGGEPCLLRLRQAAIRHG